MRVCLHSSPDRELRALKQIAKSKVRLSPEREMMQNEIRIMNRLQHDNILRLFDVRETETDVCLFLDHMAGGDLFSRVLEVFPKPMRAMDQSHGFGLAAYASVAHFAPRHQARKSHVSVTGAPTRHR